MKPLFEEKDRFMSNVLTHAWNYYARIYDGFQPVVIRLLGAFGELTYEEFEEHFVELAGVKPGQSVLDVACGTGASHETLSRAVEPKGSVVAVDISDEMLRRARQKAKRLKLANIRYRRAEADKLSQYFKESSFDVVLCCNGLPVFLNPERSLTEMARLVRSGGRLAVSTLNREKCDSHPMLRWKVRYPPGRFFYAHEYREMVAEKGFDSIQFHEEGLMLIIIADKKRKTDRNGEPAPERTARKRKRASRTRTV
ncbi:MAG: methyltransferase domain-containing protein [Candidatus Abyssobacteria bacterium SURF_17]|uniref:Methyltransferase domain-containing protein n=1 Tax=Candidatus Abyssobacteria bacterium SURF_17 TaxID=2093361 RepID=A0A419EVY4_9BACT|nr:MAG: methyltransferase domain-containing protein [Candidatus Abyssubacteria bacterium SURF_17]